MQGPFTSIHSIVNCCLVAIARYQIYPLYLLHQGYGILIISSLSFVSAWFSRFPVIYAALFIAGVFCP